MVSIGSGVVIYLEFRKKICPYRAFEVLLGYVPVEVEQQLIQCGSTKFAFVKKITG